MALKIWISPYSLSFLLMITAHSPMLQRLQQDRIQVRRYLSPLAKPQNEDKNKPTSYCIVTENINRWNWPKSQNTQSPAKPYHLLPFGNSLHALCWFLCVSKEGAGLCGFSPFLFITAWNTFLGVCQLLQSDYLHTSKICQAPITVMIHMLVKLLNILLQTVSVDHLLL